jgi:hypothetical protein
MDRYHLVVYEWSESSAWQIPILGAIFAYLGVGNIRTTIVVLGRKYRVSSPRCGSTLGRICVKKTRPCVHLTVTRRLGLCRNIETSGRVIVKRLQTMKNSTTFPEAPCPLHKFPNRGKEFSGGTRRTRLSRRTRLALHLDVFRV